MKQLSNCCHADVEHDLSSQVAVNKSTTNEACFICSKCRKYCGYVWSVSTKYGDYYFNQGTGIAPQTHSKAKRV